jgi:hypothetical protein
MKPHIRSAIESNYGIRLADCVAGPRQFVAETWILTDADGARYFCKLTDKPLFIPEIIRSLPAVAQMHARGIRNIAPPIAGVQGWHFFSDETLVVLFDYISAPQSYDYSNHAFGRLTAQIQAVTPHVAAEMPCEDFHFPCRTLFDRRFEGALAMAPADAAGRELQKVLRAYEVEIRGYLAAMLRFGERCREQDGPLVITHGDAPGNVLVRAPEDIYLIDWDEIILAPPERDLWMMDHHADFMEGFRSVMPDYRIDPDRRGFCILKYYFRGMMHYFSEILGAGDEACRLGHVRALEENLLRGWMLPKLESIGAK